VREDPLVDLLDLDLGVAVDLRIPVGQARSNLLDDGRQQRIHRPETTSPVA
jgi:hypothetical protein